MGRCPLAPEEDLFKQVLPEATHAAGELSCDRTQWVRDAEASPQNGEIFLL